MVLTVNLYFWPAALLAIAAAATLAPNRKWNCSQLQLFVYIMLSTLINWLLLRISFVLFIFLSISDSDSESDISEDSDSDSDSDSDISADVA